MPLTDTGINALRPTDKPQKVTDGAGAVSAGAAGWR